MHIGSERVEAYAGPESKHLGKEFQGTEYPKCGLKWVRLQGGSDDKESACNAGALGLIPGSRRSPEEGDDNLLHYSCLENSMDIGAWWATVPGVPKSWT